MKNVSARGVSSFCEAPWVNMSICLEGGHANIAGVSWTHKLHNSVPSLTKETQRHLHILLPRPGPIWKAPAGERAEEYLSPHWSLGLSAL